MSTCPNQQSSNPTIAQQLANLGPRTVEGDQGRVSMYNIDEAIRALEYERKRNKMRSKSGTAAVLRTISGHRLATHDGPGS